MRTWQLAPRHFTVAFRRAEGFLFAVMACFVMGLPSAGAQNVQKFVSNPLRGIGNPSPTNSNPNQRQEILGIELARLPTADGDVPIVVASEVDRFSVFWWDRQTSSWKHWQRFHRRVATTNNRTAAGLRQINWSHRIGLAAGDGYVYIVYRRNPLAETGSQLGDPTRAQVFVDAFEWDEPNKTLRTPDDLGGYPKQLPLRDLGHPDTGFYLWAGWDAVNRRLEVLFQSIATEKRYGFIPGKRPRVYVVPWRLGEFPGVGPFPPSAQPPKPPSGGEGPGAPPGSDGPPKPPPPGVADSRVPRMTPLPDSPIDWGKPQPGSSPVPAIPGGTFVISEVTKASLVLVTSAGAGVDLGSAASWSVPEVIDEGGYDLDARIAAGALHVVYRRDPYSINIGDVPGSGDLRKELLDGPARQGMFSPLFYRKINLPTHAITGSTDDIPGGDNPQIQWLEPLQISVDRPVTGAIVFSTAASGARLIHADWTLIEKCWLEDALNGSWYNTRLFAVNPRFIPRNNVLSGLPSNIADHDGDARAASAQRLRPVYLVGEPDQGQGKERQFRLLMPVLKKDSHFGEFTPRGFLGQLRFSVYGGESEVLDWHVTDFSHRQIDAVDEESDESPSPPRMVPYGGENRQLKPVTYVKDGTHQTIANTIGGALMVESSSMSPLSYFAYTDLGDGGLRVIFKATGLTPGPLVPIPKREDVEIADVGGVGMGDDVKVTLSASNWTPTQLPHYPVYFDFQHAGRYAQPDEAEPGSLGSGIHPIIDSFLWLAGVASGDSEPATLPAYEIDQTIIDDMQAAIVVAQAFAGVDTSVSERAGGDLVAHVSLSSGAPWLNQEVDLVGTGSYGTRFAVTSYQWQIEGPLTWISQNEAGDDLDEPYWAGPEVSLSPSAASSAQIEDWIFDRRGTYRVTLTVGNAGGISVYSAPVETTFGAPPGPPRDLRGRVIAATGPDTIRLEWLAPNDAGAGPQTYNIYRIIGASESLIGSTATSTPLFQFPASGIAEDANYRYVVKAVRNGVEGPASSATSIYLREGIGTVTLSVSSAHFINRAYLAWNRPALPSDLALLGYRIYRRPLFQADFTLVGSVGDVQSFEDQPIAREQAYQYVVAARLRTASGADVEGTWSAPRTVAAFNNAVPVNVTLSEIAGGIRVAWAAPAATPIAGYQVFRARRGVSGYTKLTTTDLPVATTFYVDSTAVAGQTYTYVVVSVNGPGESQAVDRILAASEIWDPLWTMMESFADSSQYAKLVDAQMHFAKYRLDFTRRDPQLTSVMLNNGQTTIKQTYDDRTITMETLGEWLTDYRFRSNAVDLRFRITVDSDHISARNDIANLIDIHSIGVSLSYIRSYALGVFMADERTLNPASMTDAAAADDAFWIQRDASSVARKLPSGLAAKPSGDSTLDVDGVVVDLSLTTTGRILANLLFIASAFVIVALATKLAIAIGLIASPNPWAMIAGMVLLVYIANVLAEPLIQQAVQGQIKDTLRDGGTKAALDGSPIMIYAGEGLAEAIARKAIQEPEINLAPGNGRDRYREQFWQMAIVEYGKAALWVRK